MKSAMAATQQACCDGDKAIASHTNQNSEVRTSNFPGSLCLCLCFVAKTGGQLIFKTCADREGDDAGTPARAACGSDHVQQGGGNWQHLLHLILYMGGIWQAQYGHEVRCEDGVGHDCRDRG